MAEEGRENTLGRVLNWFKKGEKSPKVEPEVKNFAHPLNKNRNGVLKGETESQTEDNGLNSDFITQILNRQAGTLGGDPRFEGDVGKVSSVGGAGTSRDNKGLSPEHVARQEQIARNRHATGNRYRKGENH